MLQDYCLNKAFLCRRLNRKRMCRCHDLSIKKPIFSGRGLLEKHFDGVMPVPAR